MQITHLCTICFFPSHSQKIIISVNDDSKIQYLKVLSSGCQSWKNVALAIPVPRLSKNRSWEANQIFVQCWFYFTSLPFTACPTCCTCLFCYTALQHFTGVLCLMGWSEDLNHFPYDINTSLVLISLSIKVHKKYLYLRRRGRTWVVGSFGSSLVLQADVSHCKYHTWPLSLH